MTAPGGWALIGHFGRAPVTKNGCTIVSGAVATSELTRGDDFCAITLTALDGKEVAQSHHLLLAVCGQVHNKGQKWNQIHSSAGVSVGQDWGSPPTLVNVPELQVSISNCNLKHVFALSPTGQRSSEVTLQPDKLPGTVQFSTSTKDNTIWYEIVGPNN
jgi:hypothetical protein